MKKLPFLSIAFLLSTPVIAMEGGYSDNSDNDETEILLALAQQEQEDLQKEWYSEEEIDAESELEDFELESTQELRSSSHIPANGLISCVLKTEMTEPVINPDLLLKQLTAPQEKNAYDPLKDSRQNIWEYFCHTPEFKQNYENIKKMVSQKLIANIKVKDISASVFKEAGNIDYNQSIQVLEIFLLGAGEHYCIRMEYYKKNNSSELHRGIFEISKELYFSLKFLENPLMQFRVLLNNIQCSRDKEQQFNLDNKLNEKIFKLLPKPIRDVLEEHVIHSSANQEEKQ